MIYDIVGRNAASSFSITGGLKEGYGSTGKTHDFAELIAAHHNWQAATGLILGGLISSNTITYGWAQDGTINSASEAGWKFEGSKNVLYDEDVTDDAFRARLISLASALADALGQVKVYVYYAGESIILKRPKVPIRYLPARQR
jgi:hypothetical protein